MTTDTRGPVAALRHATFETFVAGDGHLSGRFIGAEEAIRRLADQGYVLVNEKRLAAAYCRVKHGREHLTCDSYNAAAIFAAIQEQER